jgi:hypothetical protein
MVFINDGTPCFFTFGEVYDNFTQAYNWTSRLVKENKSQTYVDFSSDIAENNWLKYKANDKLDNPDYGNASIPATNQFQKDKEIATSSVFSATENGPELVDISGTHLTQLKIINWEIQTNGTYKVSTPTPRITQLEAATINLTQVGVYGETVGASAITQLLRFENSGSGLLYADLIAAHWTDYANTIEKFKQTKLKFILQPQDIVGLRFDVPVYLEQYNRYFFIKKIINWQQNTITEVELIIL